MDCSKSTYLDQESLVVKVIFRKKVLVAKVIFRPKKHGSKSNIKRAFLVVKVAL